ncbi:acyl-CoA dehydrogenase family protein [Novosphingobium sp. G106]|uniref:acyl-CoA dehydrogenase family protein n=1 Tax=Novosphingobium sp. G106 TaxID=2849500 RepID=UPI001C2DDF62|nr:acyl-CoA dehydrogenase family protein [Novosphingobium sp. G106]MBV1688892.1 acyl-CoA dehydrogenase family protein [Novosphingobium sp. G106]
MSLKFSGRKSGPISSARCLPTLPVARGRGWHPTERDNREWMRILAENGWSLPEWPVEYGGAGWSPLKAYIFEDECAAADAPHVQWRAGYSLVGPVICNFGTDAQKARYLPTIRDGRELWCQGFSEPDAGSDLASLKTSAVLDGDEYVINGQKIWTSEAQYADLMFALVRTDPAVKAQRGLSCIIIDMKTPGLTVRPIETIDNAVHVNEVFFENVRVPAANLVGEANMGWTYAKFLLGNERHSNALVQRIKREIRKLRELAQNGEFGERFIEKPTFKRKLSELEIDVAALEWAVLRSATAHGQMAGRDMAFASGLKVEASYLQQRVADMQLEIIGPWVAPDFPEPDEGPWIEARFGDAPEDVPGAMTKALFRRAAPIYGGANEIQRGIIWRAVFQK